MLALEYTALSALLTAVSYLYYRDFRKAGLLAFLLECYHFFFGEIQDLARQVSNEGLVGQYRFIIPVSGLVFLLVTIVIRKTRNNLRSVTAYLNWLLILLLFLDTAWLVTKLASPPRQTVHSFAPATIGVDSVDRPDIYLVVPDQYAGDRALREVFNYDNSGFLDELEKRGFFLPRESHSNYNLTPFSMASTLNMEYLGAEMGRKHHLNVSYSYQQIRDNAVVELLQSLGYKFYNFSLFDFPGKPAHRYESFLPYGARLITMQTLSGRLLRDWRSALLEGKIPLPSMRVQVASENLNFNDTIFALTNAVARQQTPAPKFVYAHFMLPHFPYYYDANGRPNTTEKIASMHNTRPEDYVQYLQYGNRRLLDLVDTLLASAKKPMVIMILSDHGFRNPIKRVDRAYDFMNLNAVFISGKNYSGWPDTITNVNQFRVLFNTCFHQRYPLLRDSTVDLWDQAPAFTEDNHAGTAFEQLK